MNETKSPLVHAPYFNTYLSYVTEQDVQKELSDSAKRFQLFLKELPSDKLDHRYEPSKWTIREVILHVIETEIIFGFRALTIAREKDPVNLKGFDQDHYVDELAQSNLGSADLAEYFGAVRTTTKFLRSTMDPAQLKKIGTASDHRVSVEALFYIVSGHALHHMEIVKSRYL